MSIAKIVYKIKQVLKKVVLLIAHKDTLLIVIIFTTATLSFIVGSISGRNETKTPKVVFNQVSIPVFNSPVEPEILQENANQTKAPTTIFSSRSGTKYYYSWCKGGSRVKIANRVYYDTKEQAIASGKTLASSCLK